MVEKYQFIDLIIRRDALEQSEEGLSEKIIKKQIKVCFFFNVML